MAPPRPALATLAGLVALVAAGCGADASDAATTTTSSAPEPTASTAPEAPDVVAPATTAAPTTTTTTAPPRPPTASGPLDGMVVVVDPGHNGANYAHPVETARRVDAGGWLSEGCNTTGTATVDGYSESELNWAVANLVADELVALGATVQLTRASDDGWGPCIDRRGTLAAEVGAAALVSVHADGSAPLHFGYHVIHPGPVPGYTDGIVEPSRDLALAVSEAMAARGFLPSTYVRGGPLVERSDLATLNNAGVPAVMLEAGNLRNPFEALVLRTPEAQRALAGALVDALVAFLAPSP